MVAGTHVTFVPIKIRIRETQCHICVPILKKTRDATNVTNVLKGCAIRPSLLGTSSRAVRSNDVVQLYFS